MHRQLLVLHLVRFKGGSSSIPIQTWELHCTSVCGAPYDSMRRVQLTFRPATLFVRQQKQFTTRYVTQPEIQRQSGGRSLRGTRSEQTQPSLPRSACRTRVHTGRSPPRRVCTGTRSMGPFRMHRTWCLDALLAPHTDVWAHLVQRCTRSAACILVLARWMHLGKGLHQSQGDASAHPPAAPFPLHHKPHSSARAVCTQQWHTWQHYTHWGLTLGVV